MGGEERKYESLDTLICNVTAVTMNERMEVIFGAFIGIEDGKIVSVSKKAPEEKPETIIDAAGMVAIPGLINCHTHLGATALRGYLDDTGRHETLEKRLARLSKLDARSAKASALLGIAECLRFGITSVSDLFDHPDATAQAVAQSGIKANIALAANRFEDVSEDFDFETDPQCMALREAKARWHGFDGGRIRIDAGIYAEYTGNHKLWEALSAYAAEEGLGFQLHLSETKQEAQACLERTGLEPAQLLACHGIFRSSVTATGCVELSCEERALLGKHKISAVSTPLAYAKAGLPVMDMAGNVKAGMNVALGTGDAAECGNLDLFEVMRFAGAMGRLSGGDADALPAAALLMMATVCGARAQGREATCGMLKEGMDADIALVDFSAPHLIPCHNVLGSLVFAAKGADVALTMVKGKVLYRSGSFPTIDLKALVQELSEYVIPHLFEEEK